MRASGQSGELRVSYQVAAHLGKWNMELAQRLPLAFQFQAVILRENAYWMSQEPLDLVLALGSAEWTWHEVRVQRAPGSVIFVELTSRPRVSARAVAPVRKGQQR